MLTLWMWKMEPWCLNNLAYGNNTSCWQSWWSLCLRIHLPAQLPCRGTSWWPLSTSHIVGYPIAFMFMVWGHFTFSVNLRRRDNLYSISDDQILRFILRLFRGCQTWEWESREGRDEGSLLVFLVWCSCQRTSEEGNKEPKSGDG